MKILSVKSKVDHKPAFKAAMTLVDKDSLDLNHPFTAQYVSILGCLGLRVGDEVSATPSSE